MKVATEMEIYWLRIVCDKHILHMCILLVLLRELKYELFKYRVYY